MKWYFLQILLFFSTQIGAFDVGDLGKLKNTNECSNCDLTGVSLTGANLFEANLVEVNLSGADLSGADLSRANLTQAILVGSNLSGAKLNDADLYGAYLYKANLSNANLHNANLVNSRFGETDLTDANLIDAKLIVGESGEAELLSIDVGMILRESDGYPEITSFDFHGSSIYMTSKAGKLYKSNKSISNPYRRYVRHNPDLLAAYETYEKSARARVMRILSKDLSIEDWGKRHWEEYGHHEGRKLNTGPHFDVVLDLKEKPTFRSDEEVGLLSVATRETLIYLSYTIQEGGYHRDNVFLVVEEYSEMLEKIRTIIKIKVNSFSHVAGTLVFGQFGNLYLSTGEGRDSDYESQDLDSFLGKILRIDVSKNDPTVEIVAYGLRNPWKISIDSRNRMFVGDCGEATYESVYLLDDLYPSTPYNLGWPVFEGTRRQIDGLFRFENTVAPIYEYKHHSGIGLCVIGGYFLDDYGIYVFGDYLGRLRLLHEHEDSNWHEIYVQDTRGILSLGYDQKTNLLYISNWEEIHSFEVSTEHNKILPRAILCGTTMPNGVVVNKDCG